MTYGTATILTAALTASLGTAALAGPVHFEGFEDPGFTPGGDNWNSYLGGEIQRVSTGTNSISSKTGSGHAILTNLNSDTNDVHGNPSLGAAPAFTRFDGYSSSFGGGFTASLDVYVDIVWAEGQGFEYSVAANRQNGDHLRDFVFNVGKTDVGLLVNASNNADYSFNAYKLKNDNGGDNYTITSSGWYTFQQTFYDNAGDLEVEFSLLDASGVELWDTINTPGDDIASVVGGNRYGFFTYANVNGLALDNTSLVPEPGSLALLGLGGLALLRRRR